MFVGHMRPIGRWDDLTAKAQHIWMGEDDKSVVSACGLRKRRRHVVVTRGFNLGVWDAKDTVPFQRCARCDAWRKRCGKEAVVAETMRDGASREAWMDVVEEAIANKKKGMPAPQGQAETNARALAMLDKLNSKPGERW